MSELDAEQQLAIAEQLQAQLGQLDQQRSELQAYRQELQRTRKAIDQLREGGGDDEVLVPLGAGAFVRAKLPKVERVLAPLGGGILAEEAPDKALKRLEAREAEAKQAVEQIEGNMQRMEQQLNALVQALRGGAGEAGPSSEGA